MARKTSRRAQSSTSTRKQRQSGGTRSGSAIYGDILGIAGSLLRTRQEAGAQKIGSLAGAARDFATDLTDIPNIQTYVHAAADQMETLAEYVQDNSMEQMADDAASFARRYPIATTAFAVAAGFGFMRLMTHDNVGHRGTTPKASERSTRSRSTKATVSKKRSAVKAKANGRDSLHESANAS